LKTAPEVSRWGHINIQGRKSRRRSPDDAEPILRKNYERGIDRFFITDDNFVRNKK
jgi:hypothetical protein